MISITYSELRHYYISVFRGVLVLLILLVDSLQPDVYLFPYSQRCDCLISFFDESLAHPDLFVKFSQETEFVDLLKFTDRPELSMEGTSSLFDCIPIFLDNITGSCVVLQDNLGELGLNTMNLIHHTFENSWHTVWDWEIYVGDIWYIFSDLLLPLQQPVDYYLNFLSNSDSLELQCLNNFIQRNDGVTFVLLIPVDTINTHHTLILLTKKIE